MSCHLTHLTIKGDDLSELLLYTFDYQKRHLERIFLSFSFLGINYYHYFFFEWDYYWRGNIKVVGLYIYIYIYIYIYNEWVYPYISGFTNINQVDHRIKFIQLNFVFMNGLFNNPK